MPSGLSFSLMQRVIFKECIIKVWNVMFLFSLGSVRTLFRWGGNFCRMYITCFFLFTTVQNYKKKSITIFQSYDHKCSATFFMVHSVHPCWSILRRLKRTTCSNDRRRHSPLSSMWLLSTNKNLAIANRSRVSCINTNNNTMTLKSGLEITQCHRKWCHSKAKVWFPIRLL